MKRTLARMALAPLLPLALAACGRAADPARAAAAAPPAVAFQVARARDLPVAFEYIGQTSGSREVEIRARVNGIIEKRFYQEGSLVKAGQPLFQIESALYAAAADEAGAAAASTEAELGLAQREHARLQPLANARAISQQAWDNAAGRLELARARHRQAQARHASARVELRYTRVSAPIAGIVGRALKVEGALAVAGGDSLLATLAQVDPVHVHFSIPEQEHQDIQADLAAGALRLAGKGYLIKLKSSTGAWLAPSGKLDFSDYKADPATGSYAARAAFANPGGALAPGRMVRVVLIGAIRPQAIAVPQRAVLDGPQGKFVYVVGQDQAGQAVAEARPVTPGDWVAAGPGPQGEGGSWIVRQGLRAGDRVIVDGMARIGAPGTPVQASPAKEPGAAAPGEGG
ncbi:efflux RND transporter periplasmic adaptor subunit [Massilia aquatica]|uniref:efflux RND transporter periplasmic adaptor subunit n=1 Tax=Massilia aquatica TaxID=2609000 RepID=UPI0018C87734|nr:efflux RND transporter periplasmic adaptor subunit [Massilia aquatica]